MGTEQRRKLIALGSTSLAVVLPRGWLRYYGLEAGDLVVVVTNGKLEVKPLKRRRGDGQVQG